MSGAGSTEQAYNPDIFSFRRIKVAPVVTFLGFISMIYAVVRKPKDDVAETPEEQAHAAGKTEETASKYEPKGIPVAVIDLEDYGKVDGARILKRAIKILKEKAVK